MRGRDNRRSGRRSEPEQLVLFKKRGGKRRGAGRPPKGTRAGSPHRTRPFLHERYPVHVTLRVVSAVGSLRRRRIYHAIREATLTVARRESSTEGARRYGEREAGGLPQSGGGQVGRLVRNFQIIHISVQRNHVHLVVEAAHKEALARGLQGFQISAAKHINAAISKGRPGPRRRGAVFSGRYHAEVITSPTQARHTISYVLSNFRKHEEDRVAPMATWKIDWFSSAVMFPDWAEYGGNEVFLWRGPPTYEPLQVFRPRTWLLRDGWRLRSATISCREVPSRKHHTGSALTSQ